MQPEIQIRQYQMSDAATIAEIYNESIHAGNATMDEDMKSAAQIREWMDNFDDRETILLLEKNHEVLGWGIIKKYSDRQGYRYACETAVYIGREYIGKGLGKQMKAALIERCKAYKYHHLVAKIISDNLTSIEYNKKFGYTIVGRQKKSDLKTVSGKM